MASFLFGTDVALFFLIGLLGGAHCIGMCGPLVTIYSKQMNATRADGGHAGGTEAHESRAPGRRGHLTTYEVRQHLLFNIGRAVSYTAIGAFLGMLGGLVYVGADQLTATAGVVRGVFGLVIGAAVIAIGGQYAIGRVSVGMHLPGTQHVTRLLTSWVERLASGPGILALGLVHGVLPCPILYPAYLYAFASGSPLSGGVALAALGVGTIPAVFAYGTLIDSVDAVHRERLHRLLGIVFIVLGYVLLAHGLMSLGYHLPHPKLPFWDPLGAGI